MVRLQKAFGCEAIGKRALELLREQGIDQLHSRKLRSFAEVALQ
jgi:AMP nucleosidase